MRVRPLVREDAACWLALRAALWPDEDEADLRNGVEEFLAGQGMLRAVLVCAEADALIGMIELSERAYAEGCETSPVAFIEGWFVTPERRGTGVGRALVAAAEAWARARGRRELASDTQDWNVASQNAHAALGFAETGRIVAFRKAL